MSDYNELGLEEAEQHLLPAVFAQARAQADAAARGLAAKGAPSAASRCMGKGDPTGPLRMDWSPVRVNPFRSPVQRMHPIKAPNYVNGFCMSCSPQSPVDRAMWLADYPELAPFASRAGARAAAIKKEGMERIRRGGQNSKTLAAGSSES